MGDCYAARAQRFRRQHHALGARELLPNSSSRNFSSAWQLGCGSKILRVHSSIQGRGFYTAKRDQRVRGSLAKKPASRWEKSRVVSSRIAAPSSSVATDAAPRQNLPYARPRHNSPRCCAWYLAFIIFISRKCQPPMKAPRPRKRSASRRPARISY